MSARSARVWFAATSVCVAVGIGISVVTAWNSSGGVFHPGLARAVNVFAFFTILSNLLIGWGCTLLVLRPERNSTAFAVLRLSGLVAIIVTGIVFNVALASFVGSNPWEQAASHLEHLVVPIMAVVGWLLAGPRQLISSRVVWLSLIFPALWLAFTLVRGAITPWYPYPFIDVSHLGYLRALVNCVWIAVLMLGIAAGAGLLDRRLTPRTV